MGKKGSKVTHVAYIFINFLHIVANGLQFFFGYLLMDNMLRSETNLVEWKYGRATNANLGVCVMTFACVMAIICVFNLAVMSKKDLYSVVACTMGILILINFVLSCICCSFHSMWGRYYISRGFGIINCFEKLYYENLGEAVFCYQDFTILVLWWEMTLESCVLIASMLLENYNLFGVTPDGCCGSFEEPLVLYRYEPHLIYSSYPPCEPHGSYPPHAPPNYYVLLPPYQTPSQYAASQRQEEEIRSQDQQNLSQNSQQTGVSHEHEIPRQQTTPVVLSRFRMPPRRPQPRILHQPDESETNPPQQGAETSQEQRSSD